MCGIAGRVNFRTGAPVSPDAIARMCELVRHRGPDGQQVWTSGPVGLGHRRLAVIDLSAAADQPFHSADGQLSIVFNGEIYNFQSVREGLERRGCVFTTRSDTEVILQAYREYGPDCLNHLRGMFALAIWDAPKRRLFAARDRVGKKPFYYRLDQDGVSFASEPKAFLGEPGFSAEADPTSLFHYLSYQYVPSPASAFKGVFRLPAGHYLIAEGSSLNIQRYWSLAYGPKRERSDEEAEEELLEHLREATKLRLISDVPLGAFLSGGVDSSLVVALMAEASAGPVKTFSVGFDDRQYDELPHARAVASRFGTDHHEAVVRPDAVELLPKIVWHYNEPFADSSAIPSFYLSEMTRRQVTVALNGDGGDENFAGYERYLASVLASRLERVPGTIRRAVARAADSMSSGAPRTRRARATRFLSAAADTPVRRYARWMFHFDGEGKRSLCTPGFVAQAAGADSTQHLEGLFLESSGSGLVDSLLNLDVRSYLVDDLLVKIDIATMAFGLEGRSPLLDHKVMEYAAQLPERFKLRGREKKYLLRKIARRFLPASIVDRPKMGFGVPLDRWFRVDLRELTNDVLLGPKLRGRGYFDHAVVERLVHEHQQGTRSWAFQLWNLLVFELWHRTFIDGTDRPVTTSASGSRPITIHREPAPQSTVKVLALTRYGPLGASSRIRCYQLVPKLREFGIEIDVAELLSDDYVRGFHEGRRPTLTKVAGWYLKRLRDVTRVRQYDLVWMAHEIFPYLPATFERVLARTGPPFVVDLDDAIFHVYDSGPSAMQRVLMGRKIDVVMERAAMVIAGNSYLAARATSAGARRVALLPSVVDTAAYPVIPPNGGPFTIGWIGSSSTAAYLHSIGDVLRAEAANGARLVVVGANRKALGDLPCEAVAWSLDSEAAEISRFDVGIMPLASTRWELGKCGYKLIQYMACGRPVVASAVGANLSIVQEGVTGFLARSPGDWTAAFAALSSDRHRAGLMGLAGRDVVEKKYSLSANVPVLASLLKEAAGARP